jgi:hypothetical protein
MKFGLWDYSNIATPPQSTKKFETEGFVHDSERNQTGDMDDVCSGHGIKCRSREESV